MTGLELFGAELIFIINVSLISWHLSRIALALERIADKKGDK